jgi:RimJ/RimL family protein N-acetyltransferase
MVTVRPASEADQELLLHWANDPTTRGNSFHPETIDPASHRRWLGARLGSSTSRILIGLEGGRPIGQVRLDRHMDDVVEVAISVAPEARGRGLGRKLLAAGLEAGMRDVALSARGYRARIRPENAPSIALFRHAGFTLRSLGDCDGVPCLVFELGTEWDEAPEARP